MMEQENGGQDASNQRVYDVAALGPGKDVPGALSDLDSEDDEVGAFDHMDKKKKKELEAKRKSKEKARKKELKARQKAEAKAAKEAEKLRKKEAEKARKEEARLAKEAAKREERERKEFEAAQKLRLKEEAAEEEAGHSSSDEDDEDDEAAGDANDGERSFNNEGTMGGEGSELQQQQQEQEHTSMMETWEDEKIDFDTLIVPDHVLGVEQIDGYVTALFQGANMVKYGSYGQGKEKFCIVNQEGNFFWSSKEGKMGSIKLVDVTGVMPGKTTRVLRRKVCGQIEDSRCLSIVTDKRTVDLVAASTETRDLWVEALRYASNNVRRVGKVMLHPVTTNEMQRKQKELSDRIEQLEAEREFQRQLLAAKSDELVEKEKTLVEERETAKTVISEKEREIARRAAEEERLRLEKERLEGDVQRIEHERVVSRTLRQGAIDELRTEVERLQALKDEAEEKARREKDQMSQLITESQRLLAKARGTIHKRQSSRAQHLAVIDALERDMEETKRRNLELARRLEQEQNADKSTADNSAEVIAAVAAVEGIDLDVSDSICEEDEYAPSEISVSSVADADAAAAAPVAVRARPKHRSTISFAEVSPKVMWQPDEASNKCMKCPAKFTFFKRRHHCRKCGFLVCGSCSTSRVKIEETGKKVRVCDPCVCTHGFRAQ